MDREAPESRTGIQVFALLFGVYSVAAFVGVNLFALANRGGSSPLTPSSNTVELMVLVTGILGSLLLYLRPAHRIGRLFIAMSVVGQLHYVRTVAVALAGGADELTLPLMTGYLAWDWLGGMFFLLLALTLLLFPSGSLPSPRWRPLIWLAVLAALLAAGRALYIHADLVDYFAQGENAGRAVEFFTTAPGGLALLTPHVRPLPPAVGLTLAVVGVINLVVIAAAALAQVVRYRSGDPVLRQQIKWLILPLALWAVFFLIFIIPSPLLAPLSEALLLLAELSILLVFVAIAVAILRYRLYDIDVIINRTLVYGLLTAVLVAVYFGIVLIAQSAFVALTGQESPLAIVISTLVIAALFNPLRRRIQAFIDRRFYRRRYDAARTLQHFAQGARDEVEMQTLAALLMETVDETMQPQTADLWLRIRDDR